MQSSWPSVSLREIVALSKGVSYKGEFLSKPGPRLLGLGTIVLGGGIMLDKASPYGGPVREHQRASPGDLLLAVVGITPVGSVIGSPARIPPTAEGDFAFTHHVAKVKLRDPERVDLQFLYYALRAPAFSAFVWQMQSGSTVPEIALNDVLSYELPLPPLSEQRAIARILGTLDDKIELNRRMSETLEAMARALFRSWFVDFDPVRAKAEGRETGLPNDVADLFPDRFVDSELGEIPEGWEVGMLGDVVDHLRDTENPQRNPTATYQHFSIPAFDDGQWPAVELGEAIKSQKSRVPPGAVLLSKLNPEIERVWLVDLEEGARAVCSTEFLVLMSCRPFGRYYAYCLLRTPVLRQQLQSLVTGTSKSHQRAKVASVLSLPVVRPNDTLLTHFELVAHSLLQRSLVCRREPRWLADVRDALLCRLISGELRVPDTDRILGEVA